jgi:hypothetical protein
MMCRCGHSFVENPAERPRPRVMATNTGCFVWLFLSNFMLCTGLAVLSLNPTDREGGWDNPLFGWYFAWCGLPSLVAAILLARRKRFGYTLGMVLCGINLLSIPFGTIIAIVLMTGLAKDRHLFET